MSQENPLVSIIVRTKDRPKLLKRALQSIAAQKYRPIEAVLVNDGGCDLNIEEVKSILGDVSLHYIKLENNTGRAHAGNVGIENARGEYICFLDDDDELYPGHVAILATFLEQSDYKVAYSDSVMVYEEYDPKSLEITTTAQELLFSRDFDYDFLVFENYIPFMCLLFRTEVLREAGGIDEDLELYEDWDLLIRVGEKYPFYHVKEVTSYYNQWAGDLQISQRNRDSHLVNQSYMRVLSKHRDKITDRRLHAYISGFVESRRIYLEPVVREQNEKIRNYKLMVTNLESVVEDKDGRIERLESAKSDMESCIRDIEATLENRDTTLRNIYNSRGWKALLVYYKSRDKIFPPGSRRRLFVKLCLIAAKDPKGFMKGMSRENIKKFFAQYRILDPQVIESKVKLKTSLYAGQSGSADGMSLNAASVLSDITLSDDEVIPMPPMEKNRILVIDRSLPAHDKDSGGLRMYSLLQILRDLGYRITFLPDDLLNTEPYAGDLQRMGVEILNGNVNIGNYIERNGGLFSFVIISRPEQTYKYIALMKAYAIHSHVIYDTVDLHWMRFERTGAVGGDRDFLKKSEEYKAIELFNAASADVTFAVTGEEKEILEREIPGIRVEVVPNIHRISIGETPFAARRDLMFIGSFLHQPNEDAIFYFIKEILPAIKKKLDVKFFIVGSDPSQRVLSLNSPDIVVTGYVKDVSTYFNNSRVFVSPLRYGAGMKGKIGQSLSFGLPVVTTSVGAEGIGLVNGENALIADNPESFADAVIRLYTDEVLWSKISRSGVEHIEKNYSVEALGRKIRDLFDDIRMVDGRA